MVDYPIFPFWGQPAAASHSNMAIPPLVQHMRNFPALFVGKVKKGHRTCGLFPNHSCGVVVTFHLLRSEPVVSSGRTRREGVHRLVVLRFYRISLVWVVNILVSDAVDDLLVLPDIFPDFCERRFLEKTV